MAPHFKLEKAHGGRVAGVDEVGRGPLAGPVLACALVFTQGVPRRLRPLIDDSKALAPEARQRAHDALRRTPGVEIGVGAASVAEILSLNILGAAMLAMRRAVARLSAPPDLALIDGNCAPLLACPTQCCVGGDATSLSIAAASIVAKVVRDRAMARLAARHPHYGWHDNAGYGTRYHRDALRRHGPPGTTAPPSAPSASSWPSRPDRPTRGRTLTRLRPPRHHSPRPGGSSRWTSSANCRSTRSCAATAWP